ncbi:LolA family protein [Frondihabitans peucedani]|uniref:Outer membrane lipoprotein carrier protein LolA n=1 Tax=Frondihabitans peucedani TaxID=598626 RepID=A0ABP8E467_9MICO
MKKSSLRWVPAIAIPAVVIAGAVAIPQMASADVKLPSKSAAGIVAFAEKSVGTSFTGSVTETADLGLPDLSSFSTGAGSSSGSDVQDALSQLTGTHKAKVYVDGTTKQRVQTLDDLKETDVIRNGRTVWAYDSEKKTATRLTLRDASHDMDWQVGTGKTPLATDAPTTPTEAAQKALDAIGRYTAVKVSDNVRVAGQKAYQITLTPKDDTTLVGRVTLAVDGKTGVPLRVVVKAKGQSDPAFSVAFTSISYDKPSADTFTFTPPKGTKVEQVKAPQYQRDFNTGLTPKSLSKDSAIAKARAEAQPVVLGSGWSTIVGAKLPSGALSGDSTGMLDQVLTKVDGGRVLQTALVSVYLTDDGHVYVGAVKASALEAAAQK